jgi:hypothetical protein
MSERERKWLIEPNTRAEGTTELIVRAGPWTTGEFVVPAADADQLREALREMVRQHPCHHPEGSQRQFCACCVARTALGDTPDE